MGVPFSNSIMPVIHIVPINPMTKKHITVGDVLGTENVKAPLIASDYFDIAGSFQFKRFEYSCIPLSATLEFVDPTFTLFERVLALVNNTSSGNNLIFVLTLEITFGWAFNNKTANDIVYPLSRSQTLRVGGRLTINDNELLGTTKYFCKSYKVQYAIQSTGIHYTLTLTPNAYSEEQIYSQSNTVTPANCQYLSILYKLASDMNLLLLIDDSVNINQLIATTGKFAFENKTNIDNFVRLINTVNEPGSQYRPLDFSISNQEEDARAALAQMSGLYKSITNSTDTVDRSSIANIMNNNKLVYSANIADYQLQQAYNSAKTENQIDNADSGIYVSSTGGDNIAQRAIIYTDPPPTEGKTGSILTADQFEQYIEIDQFLSNANQNTTQSMPNSNELMSEGFNLISAVKNMDISKSDREKQMLADSIQKIMTRWSSVAACEYKDWKVLVVNEEPNVTAENLQNITSQALDWNLRGKKFLGVYSHFAKNDQNSPVVNGNDSVAGFLLTSNINLDNSLPRFSQRKLYDMINEHCGQPMNKLIDMYNIAFGNTVKSALAIKAADQSAPVPSSQEAAVSQGIKSIRSNTPAFQQQIGNKDANIKGPVQAGTASGALGMYNANAAENTLINNDAQKAFYNYIREMLNLPESATIDDIYQAANKQQDCSLSGAKQYFKGAQFTTFQNDIEKHINEYFQSTINPECSTIKLIKQVTKVKICDLFNEVNHYGASNLTYNKAGIILTLRTVGDIALSYDLLNSSFLYLQFFNPNGTLNNFLSGLYLLQSYSHHLNSDSFFVTEMNVAYWQLNNDNSFVPPGNTTDNIDTGQPVHFNVSLTDSNLNNTNLSYLSRSFNPYGTTMWSTTTGSTGDMESIFQSVVTDPDSASGSNINVTKFQDIVGPLGK